MKKYKADELILYTELCENDFSKEIKSFGVVYKNGFIFIYSSAFKLEITRCLLEVIVDKGEECDVNFLNKTLLFLYLQNSNKNYSNIVEKLSEDEKNFLMLEFCDGSEIEDFYTFNIDKVKLFCVKTLFQGKEIMKLSEFCKLLKEIYRLVFKNEIYNSIMDEFFIYAETTCEDNLFENFKEFDLRFLKGKGTIFFLNTQKEALIR